MATTAPSTEPLPAPRCARGKPGRIRSSSVDPARRLVSTWTVLPTGIEALSRWWRLSMSMGCRRRLRKLLPAVLENVEDGDFMPGAITKRDYGVDTVPEGYAK